jgi:FkbM family methyltransferase
MNWKRRVANFVGNVLGVSIVSKGGAWTLIEPEQLSRFLAAFDIDCVFDVGANRGQYATKLRELGYTGHIISFEPNPNLHELLARLTSRDPKWHLEPIALDRTERFADLLITEASELGSLHQMETFAAEHFQGLSEVVDTVGIRTTTLAKLYPVLKERYGFKRPFLKMDTQGHNMAVSEGAGETLKEFFGIQSELSLTPIYRDQPNYAAEIEFFRSHGFALSGLIQTAVGGFPDLVEVDCIMYNRVLNTLTCGWENLGEIDPQEAFGRKRLGAQ